MKPLRMLYIVLLAASIGLAGFFYYQIQLKDKELASYQELAQLSNKALEETAARLAQNKQELEESLREIEGLNAAIAVLEGEKTGFQQELAALREERQMLQTRVDLLFDEKMILEEKLTALNSEFRVLDEKFHSLEELRKAIRLAEKDWREKRRLTKMEILKQLDKIGLEQGNRGFMVKNGQLTYSPSPRIKVKLEPIE